METINEFTKNIRIETLKMVSKAKASHIGTCLSCADILGALYYSYLNINPENKNSKDRDYFIMSKGHGSAAIYSTLALKGLIPMEYLNEYCCDNAKLAGHITYKENTGVEVSSGSLGHGLPIALGIAQSLKIDKKNNKVVVLLSDGECQEGSNWESFLVAPRLGLNNLTVVIDNNKLQGYDRTDDVSDFSNLKDKFLAFGWETYEVDGHDLSLLENTFKKTSLKPKLVIANTIKGKGVSYMEDRLEWHYKCPDEAQLQEAIAEVMNS